jgi:DNA polymerase-4
LWGVGPKTAARLQELGIETIGDIARFPSAELARLLGKHGEDLARRAQGIDHRPIVTEREAKSVSAETTFARDIDDGVELRQTIRRLAEGVAKRMQRSQQVGATVKLKLRWADFTTPTRQTTLSRPTHDEELIGDTALRLFDKLWTGQPVRLLGVGVSGLDEQPYQPTLWEMETDAFRQAEAQFQKQETLRSLVRDLDERYGPGAVRRGNELDTKD